MARKSLLTSLLLIKLFVSGSALADIQGETWFPLGPAPIADFFGGGVTGRASAIAVNPLRINELWLGTAAGGVWHSVDGGQRWRPIADKQPALAIGAIAVDQCTTGTCAKIYAGSGENAIRRDTYYGRGLLVFDGNAEPAGWSVRTGAPFSFDLGSINDVVLDPSTFGASKRIFVTLSSGTTSSSSQATVTAPEAAVRGLGGGYGIYRSDDDGQTWTYLMIEGAAGAKPTDLKMHPDDPSILYAGFLGVGVFVTEDGGDSWCPLTAGVSLPAGCTATTGFVPNVGNGFDHVEVALHSANPDTLYVSLGHCPDKLLQSCQPSIFRSTNGGVTWQERRRGSTTGSALDCPTAYSRYTHALRVDPLVPNEVFLGGVRLCRSIDGGSSFFASDNNLAPGGSPWGPIIHLDHREIVFHPLNANRVYATNDGGFARSQNGGIDWLPGNDDLQITGFYSLTASPNTPRVLGGSQDNSGQLWLGFRAWQHTGGGDGAYAVIDLDDPMTMYLGYNLGRVLRSLDGGLTFSSVVTPPGSSSSNAAFNAPLVQDSVSPHALYYGANRVFRSFNDASSWSTVSPVLATGPADEISPGQNVITAIGVRDAHIYIGYYGGEVFVSTAPCSSASCWTDVSAGLPAAPVTDIVIDPSDSDVAWLSFSGFATAPHVWRTEDGGASWQAADSGLPAGVPANALAIESGPDPVLWAGLDSGPDPDRSNVYRSTDGGETWSPRSAGLPNSPVHDLSIDNARQRVYVALHGRGAYMLGPSNAGVYEGRVDGVLQDVPIFGNGFPPQQNCQVRLLQQTGDECAAGSRDSIGAEIRSDANGRLIARSGAAWTDKSAVWGCIGGRCIGNVDIAQCYDDANGDGVDDPLTTVVVDCGGTPAVATVPGAPDLSNPPGSLIDVGFFDVASFEKVAGVDFARRRASAPAALQFRIDAHRVGKQKTRSACSARVDVADASSTLRVADSMRSAVAGDDGCKNAGIVAEVYQPSFKAGEDLASPAPKIRLASRGHTGQQLVAGLHVEPGDAKGGACLGVQGLGVAVHSQLQPMRTTFRTPPDGAGGGYVTYIEHTGLGSCAITVKTEKGMGADAIAAAIEAQLASSDVSVNDRLCPESRRSRSTVREGAGLASRFASDVRVCLHDPRVGFTLAPYQR